jgi:hypothetical protein
MIRKQYICDLCSNEVAVGWRIAFGAMNKISLVPFTDNSASEKLLCSECVKGLREALQNEASK